MNFNYSAETERLIIIHLEVEDYEKWLREFNNRSSAQYRHDKGKIDMSECTEDWFVHLVAKHQQLAQNDKGYIFGVFRKEDEAHLGMIDISTLARDNFNWRRIGYTIHNQHWKKGYGKDAVTAAMNMAFSELKYHRIEAHINLDNPASIALAESVGMEYECLRKGFIYENDEWTDHLIYFKQAQES